MLRVSTFRLFVAETVPLPLQSPTRPSPPCIFLRPLVSLAPPLLRSSFSVLETRSFFGQTNICPLLTIIYVSSISLTPYLRVLCASLHLVNTPICRPCISPPILPLFLP